MFKDQSLIVILFTLLMGARCQAQDNITVTDGRTEITSSTLAANSGIILLTGSWEFYWEKLLSPDSFPTAKLTPDYLYVPLSWDKQKLKSAKKNLPKTGFATYRLHISNPENLDGLAIRFMGISMACNVWVNNRLMESQGVVGTSPTNTTAMRISTIIDLPRERNIVVTIQVANFAYYMAGINNEVYLGAATSLKQRDRYFETLEMMLCGILLVTVLYNLSHALYLGENGKAFLMVAFVAVTIFFRCMVVYDGSQLFHRLFPEIDFMFIKRLDIALVNCNVFLVPMVFLKVFIWPRARYIVKGLVILGTLLFVGAWILPGNLLHIDVLGFSIAILFSFIFSLIIQLRAWLRNRPGALLLLCGTFVSMSLVGFEILRFFKVIQFTDHHIVPNLGMIALVVFLLFQTLVASKYFSLALDKAVDLAKNLSIRVKEQTCQLEESNRIKDIIFSVVAHDLRSPLNSLRTIVDLSTSKYIDCDELKSLMAPMKDALLSNAQLLDNILGWSRLQMKNFSLKSERLHLNSLVEEHLALFRPVADAKNIVIVNQVNKQIEAISDVDIIRLVLRNLVSNALKFTPFNGKVVISAQANDDKVWVSVSDTGIGMSKEMIQNLLSQPKGSLRLSTRGTNGEAGTGIGLFICKTFIESAGSFMEANSSDGNGTTFRFSLLKAS